MPARRGRADQTGATVADGQLVVWECGVDQRQWKSYGKSLRAVRSSFRLGG